jgi:hypothetical protein
MIFSKRFIAIVHLTLCAFVVPAVVVAEHQQDAGYSGKVRFDTIDTDGDDKLSASEMTAWRAGKFIARDLNGDGIIERSELIKIAKDGGRALTWDESSDFLLTYDANGDLVISLEEVTSKIDGSGFFEILDYDFSGHITRLEAEGWLDITRLNKEPSNHPPESLPELQDPSQNGRQIGDLY